MSISTRMHIAARHWIGSPTALYRIVVDQLFANGVILRTWSERRSQRRVLAELDERLLQDIGVTRSQARFEAAKPFWRVDRTKDRGFLR